MTEKELMALLGKNIKTRRKRKGWNQEKLAEKTDVSKNTISDIEAGHNFARARTLVNMAKVFETEVYELFKPDNVLPDKSADIFAKYSEEVRERVEEIENSYKKRMK